MRKIQKRNFVLFSCLLCCLVFFNLSFGEESEKKYDLGLDLINPGFDVRYSFVERLKLILDVEFSVFARTGLGKNDAFIGSSFPEVYLFARYRTLEIGKVLFLIVDIGYKDSMYESIFDFKGYYEIGLGAELQKSITPNVSVFLTSNIINYTIGFDDLSDYFNFLNAKDFSIGIMYSF